MAGQKKKKKDIRVGSVDEGGDYGSYMCGIMVP